MSDRDALLDEITLRRASIDDARGEHERGELSSENLAIVESRELAAIDVAQSRLRSLDSVDELAPTPRDAKPPRRHRRSLLVIAIICFVLAGIAGVVLAVQPRQPGNSGTGGVSGSVAERVTRLLQQGEADQAVGQSSLALAAYNEVLSLESNNVEALTQSGWLYFSAGSASRKLSLISRGEQRLATAVTLAPKDPDALLYVAIVAASTPGHRALAISEFRQFLSSNPSIEELEVARPWLLELGLARSAAN